MKTSMRTAKDPMCGIQMNVASARFRMQYQGETYYFCSAGCLESFEMTMLGHAQGLFGSKRPLRDTRHAVER